MTKWSLSGAVAAVLLLLTSVSGQQADRNPNRDSFEAGEIIIKFSPTLNALQRDDVLRGHNARRVQRFAALDIDVVRVPPGISVAMAAGGLKKMTGVLSAQPNYRRRMIGPGTSTTVTPNDPFFQDGSLWGLQKIQAPSAWTNFGTGGPVIIAGIDTGVDYTHPDLAANMWRNPLEIPGNHLDDDGNGYVDDVYGIDTANHDSDPFDDQGHGTHTVGTIAAVGNNSEGVVGVNWNSKILACKFLDGSGYGTDAGAIECFNYVVMMRNRGENIRVTSNSWGEQRGSGPPATSLQAAIDAAGALGIINVFGAGNDGSNNDLQPFDPASYSSPSIIAVASSGQTDRRSFFSNYGATSVDIAAPGEDILSTYPGGQYEFLSGTSMATPHVAGAAAFLAALDPTLSAEAIKQILMQNVDQSSKWTGKVASGGRLNVFKAATAVGAAPNNEPPTVSLTAPLEGATFKAPINITLEAAAADTDGTIQQVTFYANGMPLGGDTSAPYSVVWNAPPGEYTLTAVATDDRFATTTSAGVHVVVFDNAAPTVSITAPVEGASFTSPATVTVNASAADSDGTVSYVTFFANGVSIGTDNTAPFSATWNPAIGGYALTAVATDNLGKTGSSSAVSIVINPIPGRLNVARSNNGGVAVASSILGPNYPASGANNGDRRGLNWGAGGGWNDGTQNAGPDWLEIDFAGNKLIEEVNVFSMQDNYTAPEEPTPSMTFGLWGVRGFEVQYWDGSAWVAVPDGVIVNNNLVWRQVVFTPLVTSKIRVFITQALNGYSRLMEVEAWGIGAGGNAAPSVSITSPAEAARFTAPAAITIDASASDSDGTVQRVDFFADGVSIGSATASPWRVTWNTSAVGDHTLTAVATDNQNATTTSAAVHVTVLAANTPPSVSITAPANNSSFSAGANVTVSANAVDADGAIASVVFYANGSPIGTDSTSPFSITWSNVQQGTYALTALATDDLGATATSVMVNVTVTASPTRMNVALSSNGGVATASSQLNANYPPAGAINGDRRGLNWGAGGGWNDGTPNTTPDWIQVDFSGNKTIDQINVFSMQDNYTAPVDPTPTMTFTTWGIRNFEVQYWTGSAWAAVPGGVITNNTLVWRQVNFTALTTNRIRVWITGALNGYSRVIEVEAWGSAGGGNLPPAVSISSPAEGSVFTAPASINVTANASDSDGTIASVAFFANGTAIGTATTSPFTVAWNGVAAGTYALTAIATDNIGATTTSAAVNVTVNSAPSGDRINVALASNGGVATASSQLNANYPPSGAINGDRRGLNWGAGGGWNDGTANTSPDWIEINFSGPKSIDEVSVFSMQDNYTAPVEPTPSLTFGLYGLRNFEIQYWNGTAWVALPGGTITNNNLVWRRITFTAVTTTRIRVWVTGALNGYSRVIEVEAWGR